MPVDNPSRILRVLDEKLDHDVELTVIGKSALWLGYDDAPESFGATLDVDGVVPEIQSAALDEDLSFWKSLAKANEELERIGIYLTHIFEERQIIFRAQWVSERVALRRPPDLRHLRLFRPATLDLILSKMMRGNDPQHLEEIAWLIQHDRIHRRDLMAAFDVAKVPQEDCIPELFAQARPLVLALAYDS